MLASRRSGALDCTGHRLLISRWPSKRCVSRKGSLTATARRSSLTGGGGCHSGCERGSGRGPFSRLSGKRRLFCKSDSSSAKVYMN